MPRAIILDFDGTVAPDDIGARFVVHFGRGPSSELDQALERWRRGELGHRELTQVECRRLEVTEPEARAFTRDFELDPGFPAFARAAAAAGHTVALASEGFEFYIDDLLRRAGLPEVPFWANRLRFEGGRAIPEFPHSGGCGRCGNCKGARVREQQRRGLEVVFVGDGLSDRCGARAADRVYARGDLLDWCRAERIPAEPLGSFSELARHALGPEPRVAPPAPGRAAGAA